MSLTIASLGQIIRPLMSHHRIQWTPRVGTRAVLTATKRYGPQVVVLLLLYLDVPRTAHAEDSAASAYSRCDC